MARPLAAALLGLALALPAAAVEENPPGSVPLNELVSVQLVDRALVALSGTAGGPSIDLLLGEQPEQIFTRGRVAVVLTDRRVLAVAVRSAAWQEERLRVGETLERAPDLGDRVALIETSKRVLGFDGRTGNLVEHRLMPRERVQSRAVGENVAVVVTDRRALGLSPFAGGFFATPLGAGDVVVATSAKADVATVRTQRHLLVFRAPDGTWSELPIGVKGY